MYFVVEILGSESQVLNADKVKRSVTFLPPNNLGDEVVHGVVHIDELIRLIRFKPDVVIALT